MTRQHFKHYKKTNKKKKNLPAEVSVKIMAVVTETAVTQLLDSKLLILIFSRNNVFESQVPVQDIS